MQEQSKESSPRDHLRERILTYEERIDAYHKQGAGSPQGRGSVESLDSKIGIDVDLLDLITNGEEKLNLEGEEAEYFFRLAEDFLQGRLNDEGRDKDLDAFVDFAMRFENARARGELH